MSDKKIVDDYYSQINTNATEDVKPTQKKPIITAKKKIVVRKPSEIKADAEKANEKKSHDLAKNQNVRSNEYKPKNIVQKIEVIKRSDRPNFDKSQNQKPFVKNNNSNNTSSNN